MKEWDDLTKKERTSDAGYSEAVRRISQALEEGKNRLNLANLELIRIPTEIKNLTTLISLNINNNKIADISPLKNLTELTEVRLSSNKICDISSLRNLTGLKNLYLNYNSLDDIGPLAGLTCLTDLNLSGCKLVDITSLANLKALRSLRLKDNRIVDLSTLSDLTGITNLSLSANRLVDISPLRDSIKLTNLRLDVNNISDISPLANLTGLKVLWLNKNRIVDLAPLANLTNLKQLRLKANFIESLYPIYKLLEKRPDISLNDNYSSGIQLQFCPLTDPPLEIAQQGAAAVLQYWDAQDRLGLQKAYEGRVMIVGRGKVGKTSLLRKLEDPKYKLKKEKQTHGMNIWRDWTFPVPDTEADFRASVWDFGGQDIQHKTHQYFFKPNSVYVLVLNLRKLNAAEQSRELNYWFRIIELLGRHAGRRARVLVVHNVFSSDGVTGSIDLRPYEKAYEESLELSLHTVKLHEESGESLAKLKGEIEGNLLQLPQVGRDIIKGWPDIRKTISERRRERRMSFGEFAKVCAPHNITTAADQRQLLDYLDELGEILYYGNDRTLAGDVLMDINWITDAVYAITDDQAVVDGDGRLHEDTIIDLWQQKAIDDPSDHALMLRLLQKDAFELSWKTKDDHYLTPSLFSAAEPTVSAFAPNLRLRFSYGYLPDGLLDRLIVRLNDVIDGDSFWREGTYLRWKDCRGKVHRLLEEKDRENTIELLIEGPSPNCRQLLDRVYREAETIREEAFRRAKVNYEVPCPCRLCGGERHQQKYFPHEDLQRWKVEGKRTVVCGNQEQVDLQLLIEGLPSAQEEIANARAIHVAGDYYERPGEVTHTEDKSTTFEKVEAVQVVHGDGRQEAKSGPPPQPFFRYLVENPYLRSALGYLALAGAIGLAVYYFAPEQYRGFAGIVFLVAALFGIFVALNKKGKYYTLARWCLGVGFGVLGILNGLPLVSGFLVGDVPGTGGELSGFLRFMLDPSPWLSIAMLVGSLGGAAYFAWLDHKQERGVRD